AELVAESIQRFVQEGRPLPLDVLMEGLSKGELRPAHPLQTWWSIVGMCVFSLEMREVTRHVDPRKLPVPLPRPGETRDQIVRLVCDGLARPAKTRRRRNRNKPAHS